MAADLWIFAVIFLKYDLLCQITQKSSRFLNMKIHFLQMDSEEDGHHHDNDGDDVGVGEEQSSDDGHLQEHSSDTDESLEGILFGDQQSDDLQPYVCDPTFETEEELSKFMTAELQNVTNIADIYFENLR